ncbi:autotransporter outer membrane beta-barrel domain-containing protein [Brucella intermedia]|uniref:autotransporter outer membrane beta-barrel domain-containing protein n=1 Tax=Brucella intermedia TaxID=94625 RepID=UPI003CE562DA
MLHSSTDPIPSLSGVEGEDADQGGNAGGGGGGVLAIVDAPDYTVDQVVRGGKGGGASDNDTNGKPKGAGGGGAAFILNGDNFTIGSQGYVSGGDGGARNNTGNPSPQEYGGGGGVGIVLNHGTLNVDGRLLGGDGGVPKDPQNAGSPGAGLFMVGGTTVNVGSNGSIQTGSVQNEYQKAPPAIILEGNNSRIVNQGTIFRGFATGQKDAFDVPAIYVHGNNNEIINGKLIQGNNTVGGGSTAKAIEFEGDNNKLELWGNQQMQGTVEVISGVNNHLVLGGSVDGTFNFGTLDQVVDGGPTTQRTGYMGFADFEKSGTGTWTGGGVSHAVGPWTINEGTLALIDDGDLSSHDSVTLNANLDISGITDTTTMRNFSGSSSSTINLGGKILVLKNDNGNPQTFAGVASGAGGGIEINQGTEIFTGNNTYTGLTTVAAGANLQLGDGGATGGIAGDAFVDGKLIFERSDDPVYNGAVSGSGSLEKFGAGILTMTGDSGAFTGDTTVSDGTLWVNGTLGGTLDILTGTTLGGTGTVGRTTIENGGTLKGNQGDVLTFDGDLTLNGGSFVDVALGKNTPNTRGLFDVHGNLALNGSTLNITDQGDFGPGTYRLFDYGGTLTGDLVLGDVPQDSDRSAMDFDKSNPGHYDLYYAGQVANNIWIGGDGTWNVTNQNWTDIHGSQIGRWNQGDYAQFRGTPGTVTVDDSGGDITAQGLVFSTDGYVLDGDYLTLKGDKTPTIRVGDGSAGGANITAKISLELRGNQGMTKIDYGTLILTGTNSYTGGTTINQGTLQLGDGGTTGSIQGDVVVNVDQYGHGTLAFDRSDTYNFSGTISGGGDVVQRGTGTTVFEGNNTFSGGLTVEHGIAQAGIADHAFGSGLLTVDTDGTADLANFNETVGGLAGSGHVALGSGTLTLNQDIDTSFSGKMDGTGGVTKNGSGKLTLSGTGSWSGDTDVNGGSLIQGAAGGFSASSNYSVAKDAVIDLGGFATSMVSLNNGGTVNFGGNGGTTLNVAGNYTGNGGTVVINSVLGGDGSTTDMLKIGGDTSGNTHLKVINRGGLGDQTVSGIEVIEVGGKSDGQFSLIGDFVTKDGKQAVSGGAYAYTLQQGSGTGNNDGNWYLTSQLDNPGPDPRYSPSVPVYEGYLNNMQALNKLPTLQERVGERYWTGKNGDGGTNGAAVDDKGVWARVEGAHNRLEPDTSLTRMKQDVNTFIMQAGVDGQFYEGANGKLIAGITGQYGHAKGDISSFHGDGAISTDAWSLGATATWYGNSGFYVDGQAQVTWFDSDLNSWTANQGLADGRKATGYALSIEAGQRFAIDQNWSLTPQAQLMYSSINTNAFNDTWGSRVSLHDGDSLIGRIGLAANYANSWKGDDGLMVNTTVYGIANLYQEMLGGSSVNVAGVDFDTDNDKTWGGIGAGGTYAWADNKYAIYGEGSVNTALNHFADSYALKGTVGFKVKW